MIHFSHGCTARFLVARKWHIFNEYTKTRLSLARLSVLHLHESPEKRLMLRLMTRVVDSPKAGINGLAADSIRSFYEKSCFSPSKYSINVRSSHRFRPLPRRLLSRVTSRRTCYIRITPSRSSLVSVRVKDDFVYTPPHTNDRDISPRSIKKIRFLGEFLYFARTNSPTFNRLYSPFFVTFTVTEQLGTDKEYNAVFGRFLEYLRRNFYISHYVWRAEKQKRGAIHWHVLLVVPHYSKLYAVPAWDTSCPIPSYFDGEKYTTNGHFADGVKSVLHGVYDSYFKDMHEWRGEKGNFIDFEYLFSPGGVSSYLAKYTSKQTDKDHPMIQGARCVGMDRFLSRFLSWSYVEKLDSFTPSSQANLWSFPASDVLVSSSHHHDHVKKAIFQRLVKNFLNYRIDLNVSDLYNAILLRTPF